jgi:hypothetical protein
MGSRAAAVPCLRRTRRQNAPEAGALWNRATRCATLAGEGSSLAYYIVGADEGK